MSTPKTKKGIASKTLELESRIEKQKKKLSDIEVELHSIQKECKHEDTYQYRETSEDGEAGFFVAHCPTCKFTLYSVEPFNDLRIKK